MEPSTRHGLTRQLAGLDVQAASLPPSAVLLVRRLADPRPRSLDPSAPGVRPPLAWEAALQQAIDRAGRDAVRPAWSAVPPSAEAVVFLDSAELLACLARDFLRGAVPGNWWWQAWLRASGRSTVDLVLDAWVREARHAPAAAAILHDQRLAEAFANALSPRQARALFIALAEAYGLAALAAPTPSADVPIVLPQGVAPTSSRRRRSLRPLDASAGTTMAADTESEGPPWAPLIAPGSVPPTLGIEQRAFLGVALALALAPLAVRTRAFARSFHRWRRAKQFAPQAAAIGSAAQGTDEAPSVSRPVAETEPPIQVLPPADSVVTAHEETAARVAPPEPLPHRWVVEPVAPPTPHEGTGRARSGDGERFSAPGIPRGDVPISPAGAGRPETGTSEPKGAPLAAATPEPAIARPRSGRAPNSPAASSVSFAAPAREADLVPTGLAGVLFLINALERLELFDRLDDHFGVASSMGGWAWLEIVARGLLGPRRDDAASDPIWDVLASLDGRQSGAPISGAFRGPRSYRRPESWPAPAAADARRPGRGRNAPLGLEPTRELRRFLDFLVPYVRWRVVKGLGLEAPADDAEGQLVSRLLHRRGRLSCTRTHVDLYMGMGQVDIAIRLAGLDANPGWVPALGHVVTFHYD